MTSFLNLLKFTTLLGLLLAAGCGDDGDSAAELNITEDSKGEVADTEVAIYSTLEEHDALNATDNIATRE